MRRRAFFSLAACALAGWPALAQESGRDESAPADISGGWTFEVEPYFSQGCVMSGELSLTPRPEGGFACRLFAEERCVSGRVLRARQDCEAVIDGATLSLSSTIAEVEPPGATYFPDDFELTIVDGSLMRGELQSSARSPAIFHRGRVPTS